MRHTLKYTDQDVVSELRVRRGVHSLFSRSDFCQRISRCSSSLRLKSQIIVSTATLTATTTGSTGDNGPGAITARTAQRVNALPEDPDDTHGTRNTFVRTLIYSLLLQYYCYYYYCCWPRNTTRAPFSFYHWTGALIFRFTHSDECRFPRRDTIDFK